MKVLNFLFVVVVTTLLVGTLLFSEENTWKGPVLVNTVDVGVYVVTQNPAAPGSLAQSFMSYLTKDVLEAGDRNQLRFLFRANNDNNSTGDLRFASSIEAIVEAPNNSTKKSALRFLTTNTGKGQETEKMRITGDGIVKIYTTAGGAWPAIEFHQGIHPSNENYYYRGKIYANPYGIFVDREFIVGGGSLDPVIRMTSTDGSTGFIQTLHGNGGVRLYDGKDYTMHWKDGKVGIGTTEPSEKLHVNGIVRIGYTQIYDNEINRYNNSNLYIGYRNTSNTILQCNGGNVGIGTQSPMAKLDVNGNIAVNGMKIIDSKGKWTGDPTGLKGDPGPQGPTGPQGPPGTSLWTDVRANVPSITTSANVGIGMKPESTYKLQVSGGARIRDYLIIDADPKVYKPGSTLKLTVNGDIKATGKVFASCGTLTCSDVRYKKDLKPIENALDRVIQLRGVSFNWKDESMGKGQQLGVIGQEVEKVFPEVVSTDSDGYKSVAYSQLVAPLIEAIKELKAENETLKVRIETLEKKLKDY